MKSETEIRSKLHYYQGVLAGYRADRDADTPEALLAIENILPGEGMGILRSAAQLEAMISKFPPYDQQRVRHLWEDHGRHMLQFCEDRIAFLKWILDE